ncbi:MAG: type II secretion system protein GspH [Planctomycetota bacterium]|nr:MAG: type II secretion system protein GspH [Planctomycetota bacterium]
MEAALHRRRSSQGPLGQRLHLSLPGPAQPRLRPRFHGPRRPRRDRGRHHQLQEELADVNAASAAPPRLSPSVAAAQGRARSEPFSVQARASGLSVAALAAPEEADAVRVGLPSPGEGGFTLLELLLVLVLLGILALLVAPRFAGARSAGALEAQARAAVALARKARALAAAEGRTYLLRIDPVHRTLRLARRRDPLAAPGDEDAPELDLGGDAVGWSAPLPFREGVVLRRVERGAPEAPVAVDPGQDFDLRFFPDGTGEDALLVFSLAGADEERWVRFDAALGLARLAEPEAAP